MMNLLVNLVFGMLLTKLAFASSENMTLTCPPSIRCSNDGNLISTCRFNTYQNEEIWGPNTFKYYTKPLLNGTYYFKRIITPANELLKLEKIYSSYFGPACIYGEFGNPESGRYIAPWLGEASFKPLLNNQTQWVLKDNEGIVGECYNNTANCPVIENPELVITQCSHQINPFKLWLYLDLNKNTVMKINDNRISYQTANLYCNNKSNCVIAIIHTFKNLNDPKNYIVGKIILDVSEPNKIKIINFLPNSSQINLSRISNFNVIKVNEKAYPNIYCK
jgi:hypothetical protein